jgi:hypothetical protein
MPNHSIDQPTQTAIDRATTPLVPPWRYPMGPAVAFTLPGGAGMRAVRHGLGVRPDGLFLVLATGACYAYNPAEWTDTLAFVTGDPLTRVTAIFYTLRALPEEV